MANYTVEVTGSDDARSELFEEAAALGVEKLVRCAVDLNLRLTASDFPAGGHVFWSDASGAWAGPYAGANYAEAEKAYARDAGVPGADDMESERFTAQQIQIAIDIMSEVRS